ncbi:DUF402 domain-containing protein [Heyndrickxia oleronia]|nr:DUF402 domain-containing protein [Heyndrickxia oleronia]
MYMIYTPKTIIERKIRYDSSIVEHSCLLLNSNQQKVVLFHRIAQSFTMKTSNNQLTIPKGSYTLAYYWCDRPYNLYIWRDLLGNYLGAYFNIVKNTYVKDRVLSFEDLIIDVLVFPDGQHYVLDEDELPESLDRFENGFVNKALVDLQNSIDDLLPKQICETMKLYNHESVIPLLKND